MFYAVNLVSSNKNGTVYWQCHDGSLIRADDRDFDPIYFENINDAEAADNSIVKDFSFSIEKYGAYVTIVWASTLKGIKETVMNYPLHIITG